jgi:hypothetical protein
LHAESLLLKVREERDKREARGQAHNTLESPRHRLKAHQGGHRKNLYQLSVPGLGS